MPVCPNGHSSDDPQYCSICGVEIAAAAETVISEENAAPAKSEPAEPCPICGAERQPTAIRGDFCEVCGYNFRTGTGGIPPAAQDAAPPVADVTAASPAPSADHKAERWELHAEVDPGLQGAVDPDAPRDAPIRLFPLDSDEALIGRRSVRRSIFPEVALDGDDGISHRHAKLLRQPDGRYAVLDLGSSNGVRLNGKDLASNVLSAPLADCDLLEIGRWTRLTVRARK